MIAHGSILHRDDRQRHQSSKISSLIFSGFMLSVVGCRLLHSHSHLIHVFFLEKDRKSCARHTACTKYSKSTVQPSSQTATYPGMSQSFEIVTPPTTTCRLLTPTHPKVMNAPKNSVAWIEGTYMTPPLLTSISRRMRQMISQIAERDTLTKLAIASIM